jgi:5-methylcytosine-specific restriction endonuclease McrA
MPRPISKKGLKKKLDELWSELVKREAGNKCEVCGKTEYLNSHHIVGRRNLRLRWELYNSVCLCPGCHTFKKNSAHQNPVWFDEWLRENRSEDYNLVKQTMNEIKKWTMDEMMELREDFEEELS